MRVNSHKTEQEWAEDTEKSVDLYNTWYTDYAPKVFLDTREKTAEMVRNVMAWTDNFRNISPEVLSEHPEILPTLRMTTCPPIARDRLIGLSGVKKRLVETMEKETRLPARMPAAELRPQLMLLCSKLSEMIDTHIFPWLLRDLPESDAEVLIASTIIADRLCGAESDPIIRNAQEDRQLQKMKRWLESNGYRELYPNECTDFREIPKGTFTFRMNVLAKKVNDDGNILKDKSGKDLTKNIPVDAIIMRKDAKPGDFPALFEAKSAGDFTNTNKRAKEETTKIKQLKATYGPNITFDLLLGGYFQKQFLKDVMSVDIDWVWEHRIEDLEHFGF